LIFSNDSFYEIDDFEVVMRVTSGGVEFGDYKPNHTEYTECSPAFEYIEYVNILKFSISGDVPPSFEVTFMVGY
jgi:hypothetical protein